MASFVVAMILLAILYILVTGALGMFIATEKGNSAIQGWLIGNIFPLFGHILIAMQPPTSKQVIEDVYSRGLMTKSDYEKTKEILVKKLKEEK